MHPSQLMPLLALLDEQPEEVSAMFGGAPIEAIRKELLSEKKKYDKLLGTATRLKGLKDDIAANSCKCTDTLDRANKDAWSVWIRQYVGHLKVVKQASGLAAAVESMRRSNPTFILRNWIAQEAIAAAEQGDYSKVQTVLHMLTQPYRPDYNSLSSSSAATLTPDGESSKSAKSAKTDTSAFVGKPPVWADGVLCTCSS